MGIRYTDAQGRPSERIITILDCHPHSWGGQAIKAWCHSARDRRTFVADRIDAAWDGETGEIIEKESAGEWALMQLGRFPSSVIPEIPPGRLSTRRPHPPIKAAVEWERTPGDLEVFDIDIDEIELAAGRPFAFSGRARRRKSATDRAWSGRRRFKLRGWDTQEAPIRALYPDGDEAPIAAPMQWLKGRTER